VGGAGITINAGASDAISLRGLTIDGQGRSNTNGIVFNSGGSLTIRDCVVRRNVRISGSTAGMSLVFQPNGASNLAISDSVFESNSGNGIAMLPTGGGDVKAVLNRIEANGSFHGLAVSSLGKSGGSVKVSVFDSVAAYNSASGFAVFASGSIPARITLMQSVSANNSSGVTASASLAIIRIGQSMVTDNGSGSVAIDGGQIRSYGTNQVDGNTNADTIPTKIPLD
jgi:hypothetical protein